MNKVDSPFFDLYKRAQLTARSRFNAYRRLSAHNSASQWTVSIFSICLIFHSLVQVMGLNKVLTSAVYSLINIASAIVILVFSIILSKSEFGSRSQKMHQCGLEINSLVGRIRPFAYTPGTDEEYINFQSEYDIILAKYDNHENIDFDRAKIGWKHLKLSWFKYFSIWFRYLLGFLIYSILLVAQLILVIYIFK